MRLANAALGLALAASLWATVAGAQVDPGDLGVYFDQDGAVCSTSVAPFVTTHQFFALGVELGDIAGYEFGLTIDPSLIIFSSADATNPGNSINVGTPPSMWIVGIGTCLPGTPVATLVQFTYGYFTGGLTDMTICLGPATPTSFDPPAPGYLDCIGQIFPSGVATFPGDYPAGCAVVNPTGTLLCEPPVANDASTWGALKAAY